MIHLLLQWNKVLRSRWFAPTLHILLFAITWITVFVQSESLLDGPARWGFTLLLILDFPISLVAYSAIWDNRLVYALSLWGILGTAWWYFVARWINGNSGKFEGSEPGEQPDERRG